MPRSSVSLDESGIRQPRLECTPHAWHTGTSRDFVEVLEIEGDWEEKRDCGYLYQSLRIQNNQIAGRRNRMIWHNNMKRKPCRSICARSVIYGTLAAKIRKDQPCDLPSPGILDLLHDWLEIPIPSPLTHSRWSFWNHGPAKRTSSGLR